MADIAAIFHWTPAAMDGMDLAELMDWRQLAVRRFNQMNGEQG